jgi:hypothetical protein
MIMVKRFLACLFVWSIAAVTLLAQQPAPARDQYLPIDQLPPSEKMPSAPFVIAAYAVIWAVAMFYMWTIWRRAGKVEADMQVLARRQKDVQR